MGALKVCKFVFWLVTGAMWRSVINSLPVINCSDLVVELLDLFRIPFKSEDPLRIYLTN